MRKDNKGQPQEEVTKKKKESINPLKLTEELQKIGETYSKVEKVLGFLIITAIGLVLGLLFSLPVYLLVVIAIFYLFLAPKLLYNLKKQKHERKRFDDANAYLSQMSQSFTSTNNILASLKETHNTFLEGRMRKVLEDAIQKIETSTFDVRQAEVDALGIIAEAYDCEKVRNLHDFLIKAEVRGGDCVSEFKILEKIRMAWSTAVMSYHAKLTNSRNLVTMEFGLLLAVCIFFLRRFPDSLALISVPAVQVVNAIEIILFFFVFLYTDSKLNKSMLQDVKYMTEEEVEKYQDFVNNFDAKAELKKNTKLILIGFVLSGAMIAVKPSVMAVVVAVLFMVLIFNMHHLQRYLTARRIRDELHMAFPKWLFDIMLLIQTSSVEAAIFTSEELAPPILKRELRVMSDSLRRKPGNPDAYMSFLASYKIPGVEDTMRKLYSLSVGTGNREIVQVIIDANMSTLSEAEQNSLENKGNITKMYSYLPIICISGALIMYCIMLMVQVFAKLTVMVDALG